MVSSCGQSGWWIESSQKVYMRGNVDRWNLTANSILVLKANSMVFSVQSLGGSNIYWYLWLLITLILSP